MRNFVCYEQKRTFKPPLSGHPVRAWRSHTTACVDTAVQGEAGTKCPAGTAITAATRSALQSLLSESRPLTAAPHLAAAVLERFSRSSTGRAAQPDLGECGLRCF